MNEDRILRLEKKVRRQQTMMIALLLIVVGSITMAFDKVDKPGPLRVTELTVVNDINDPVIRLTGASGHGIIQVLEDLDSTEQVVNIGATEYGGHAMFRSFMDEASITLMTTTRGAGVIMLKDALGETKFSAP